MRANEEFLRKTELKKDAKIQNKLFEIFGVGDEERRIGEFKTRMTH